MLRALAFVPLLLGAASTLACGYCVEDKIASTYDHAVVTQAAGGGHHVAFFHIDGPLGQDTATRKFLAAQAEKQSGVDRGSVRIALDTLTMSLAFDPGRVTLARLLANLDRSLAARKLSLMPIRIMEKQ